MNEQSRLFDFLYYQHRHFPQADLLASKSEGKWIKYSTEEIIDTVNQIGRAHV